MLVLRTKLKLTKFLLCHNNVTNEIYCAKSFRLINGVCNDVCVFQRACFINERGKEVSSVEMSHLNNIMASFFAQLASFKGEDES